MTDRSIVYTSKFSNEQNAVTLRQSFPDIASRFPDVQSKPPPDSYDLDITPAQKDLGWSPSFTREQTVRDAAASILELEKTLGKKVSS